MRTDIARHARIMRNSHPHAANLGGAAAQDAKGEKQRQGWRDPL